MASDDASPAAGPNRAQAEFEKYAQRRQAAAAMPPGAGWPGFGPPGPGQGPGGDLTWGAPIGFGMAPVYFGGPPPAPPAPAGGVSGLIDALGNTARLGVDLLNTALFNSVKILGGFTGAYGSDAHEDCGCGCGCGSSCCEPSCCECDCCHPGVGSC